MWHLTPDAWHLTRDKWHVTSGGWKNILKKFQVPRSFDLGKWCFEGFQEYRRRWYNVPFCALFGPFWHIFALFYIFCTLLTPFNKFDTFWKNLISSYFSLFIGVTSWDSVPIPMCYLMQAPHWSQSHSLDSQCIVYVRSHIQSYPCVSTTCSLK